MVSKIIFRLSLIVGVAALAYAGVNAVKAPTSPALTNFETYEEVEIPFDALRAPRPGHSLDAFDSTIVLDDMEAVNGWTHSDQTATQPAYWHVDNVPIGDPNAPAWWVGNASFPDNAVAPGGYDNAWQQHLESPSINLSAATAPVTLAFKARWKIEQPGGEPAGYDMWDGWNLQVSTDGGTTWAVITAGLSHAFTGQSSYAFGEQWCLGPNIPAWGSTTYANAYTVMTADLSSYVGQADLKFRYSFFSDPGFSAGDDSSYYGLIVDSIRVSHAGGGLLSNDGVAGGGWTTYAVEGGGIGDTWDFEDSTAPTGMTAIPDQVWSWNAEHRGIAGLNNALRSPLIVLPDTATPGNAGDTQWNKLKMAYYVWADLEDSDGDNDGALDDLYEIYVSADTGATWTRVAYDYGTTALTGDNHPDAGNSLNGWVRRGKGLSTGGVTGDINLTPWGEKAVYIEFRLQTDCNNDGGIGSGLHVDYPHIVATRAFATDEATGNMLIPFPVTVGLARPWTFDLINEGSNDLGPSHVRNLKYNRPDGSIQGTDSLQVLSGVTLTTNQRVTVSRSWIPDVSGAYRIRVNSRYLNDQDRTNDTTRSPINVPLNGLYNMAVDVQPAGTYELGYHHRDWNAVLSNPRYVRYSPAADGVPAADADTLDINKVQIMWNWDPTDISSLPDGTARCRIEFFGQGPDNRTPGALLYTYEEEIDTNETVAPGSDSLLNRWWQVDLSAVGALKRISGDFWVAVSGLDTVGTSGLPGLLALVTNPQDTTDTHNYTKRLDIVGEPILASPSRFCVEVTTNPTTWPDPVNNLTIIRDGVTNDCILRWSASNRADGYLVYRSTDVNNPLQTLLTASPIAPTTYTDTGVLNVGDKFFYVVVAVNS